MESPVIYEIIENEKLSLNVHLEYREAILKVFFNELKDFLLRKFLDTITAGRTLIKYDEKIYDYYNMIIDYYRSAVYLYRLGKNELVSEGILRIADGIQAVLECQISQFEEASLNENGKSINPVLREKEKIIDRNITTVSKSLDMLKCTIESDFCLDGVKKYMELIYNIYCDTVKTCFIQLNDIHSRKTTSMYYDIIKEERESLSSIIKVQAEAIENEIQNADEEAAIQSVLMKLREGYQHLSKRIHEMEESFKTAVVYDEYIEKFDENFENGVLLCMNKAQNSAQQLKNSFEYYNSMLLDAFGKTAEEFVGNAVEEFFSDAEKVFKDIDNTVFLSEKIASKFNFIFEYTAENRKFYENTEFGSIIEGIFETLDIKVQNIEENAENFISDCHKVLPENYDSFKSEVKKYLSEEIMKAWRSVDDKDKFSFFENKIKDCAESIFNKKILAVYHKKFERVNKLILNIKRESILYEISTFEEVMNYSVSRMRSSENVYIKKYVETSDYIFAEIKQILFVSGIEVIAPAPHEPFNGREHDVMMAEKNADFKKGEVIKVMNSGYKQNEHIILRANVIAAK